MNWPTGASRSSCGVSRALIDLGRLDEANRVLDEVDASMRLPGSRPDWRIGWYRGVASLAAGAPDDAGP